MVEHKNDGRDWLRDRAYADGKRDAEARANLWTSAQEPPPPLTRQSARAEHAELYRHWYVQGWQDGGGEVPQGTMGFPW